jgi:hypothetical protein
LPQCLTPNLVSSAQWDQRLRDFDLAQGRNHQDTQESLVTWTGRAVSQNRCFPALFSQISQITRPSNNNDVTPKFKIQGAKSFFSFLLSVYNMGVKGRKVNLWPEEAAGNNIAIEKASVVGRS